MLATLESPSQKSGNPSRIMNPKPAPDQPGKIVSIVNSKGGVGKSTISMHLVCALKEIGVRVKLADADGQASSSNWLERAGLDIPFARLTNPDSVVDETMAMAADGSLVIADGPAGDSEINRTLLWVSDVALLPCGPSPLDLEPLTATVRALDRARKSRKGLPVGAVIPNKLKLNANLSGQLLAALQEYGVPVLPGLGQREAYPEAVARNTTVWNVKTEGAKQAKEEIRLLVNAIQELVGVGSTRS